MALRAPRALGLTLWLAVCFLVPNLGAASTDAPLVNAVKLGDTAAVRVLLGQHPDVNAAEPDGTTALHWAVQRDNLEVVDLLLRAGASAKTANRYGVTPLSVACTNGNAAIIQKLLNAGADPNAPAPDGETALMTAARTGKVAAVKMLLASGADVNAKEQARGQSALMWAAAENHAEAAAALVEANADVSARSNGGFTALLFAVRAGSMDAVKILLDAGASANDAIQPPGAARPAATTRAQPAGGQQAAAPGATRPAATPTRTEPAGGQQAAAPQRAQTTNGLQQLLSVFNTGSRGRSGAGGTDALMLAITNAHFELAALLLDRGADPNADAMGWTALHQLAWTRRPPIQHGLPPPVQTGNVDSLTLARKLLERGANPNARMTREPSDGARNILNRLGSTPFLQAAKLGDIPYMRLLVEHGADASITTEEGATALMAAAGVGIWQVGESAGSNEEAFEAVKICYGLGNDVNASDVNGDTALHGAAHRGANEVVRFLVEKGAKMDVPNTLGWTPWIIADGVFYPNTYNRRLDTAQLLVKLGASTKAGTRRAADLPPSEAQTAPAPRP